MKSKISGYGKSVGDVRLTNSDVAAKILFSGGEATDDNWISERTGIKARNIIGSANSTAKMATQAAKQALESAGLLIGEIDLIILATITGDYYATPSTACLVQENLGAGHIPAFDINAACSGFVYGLILADSLIKTMCRHVLVIGSEALSSITNWSDRSTAPLFGDGAGAFILSRNETGWGVIIDSVWHSKGNRDLLYVPAGGCLNRISQERGDSFLKMKGKEVFKFAVKAGLETVRELLQRNAIDLSGIKKIFIHQANQRITESMSSALGLPLEKFHSTIQYLGNTSSASIPLGVIDAAEKNLISKGDKLLLVAFGGGLTWGGLYLEWPL